MVISGDLNFLYDDRILSEYREGLLREKFGFKEYDVDILLEYIETEGIRITAAVSGEPLLDKDDIPFLEVALSGKADVLVTGNKRNFKVKSARGLKILSPEEFLKLLKQRNKLK